MIVYRVLLAVVIAIGLLSVAQTTCVAASATQPAAMMPGAVTVLDYLNDISGKLTVAGMHNREPNSQPAMQTDRLFKLVGRYPGLWSGDFLYQARDIQNRWTMIRECRKQWEQGCIVQLMLLLGVSPNAAGGRRPAAARR